MLSPRGFVFLHIPNHLPLFLRSPRNIVALGFGIAVATGVTSYVLTRRRPTPEEIERERRDHLAANGRITDGSITETRWLNPAVARSNTPSDAPASQASGSILSLNSAAPDILIPAPEPVPNSAPDKPLDTPAILVYRYVIAGVTYECAQDVTPLVEHVRHVRVDLPIQVRFDPRNPGNSIVVAETWSGLRLGTYAIPPSDPHSTEQTPD